MLINNAGTSNDAPALLMDTKKFTDIIESNLYGPFLLMKLCGKKMLLKRSGVIVNISSLSGQIGNPGQASYAASKAGLISLTKTLAIELGNRGIRVNAVAPGFIDTEMISGLDTVIEQTIKQIPMRRIGTADEVAGVVSFLCSNDASYVTGQTLCVNGGQYRH